MLNLKLIQENAKQKQAQRYRKQANDYQKGERRWKGQIKGMGLRDTNYCA